MRLMWLCLLLVVFVCGQQFYDKRYDYFDIDSLVQNRRLLKKYLDCFLSRGPCPPIGRVFKALLPEVVQTKCAKCTPRQKALARKAFRAFKSLLPEGHMDLVKKLDPQGVNYNDFEKAIGLA